MNFENLISAFELGELYQTLGISEARKKDPQFNNEVNNAFKRYCRADFKGMYEEDIELNTAAIKNNNDRIFGAYDTLKGKIYIITEYDRSHTTILFADEY